MSASDNRAKSQRMAARLAAPTDTAEWDDLARHAEAIPPEEREWSTYAAYGSRGVEVAATEDMLFIQGGGVTYAVNEDVAEFIAAANPATILRLIAALDSRCPGCR